MVDPVKSPPVIAGLKEHRRYQGSAATARARRSFDRRALRPTDQAPADGS